MLEAQDMFRTANKVTRPEKAVILGFMAGSRGKFDFSYVITYLAFMYLFCFSLIIKKKKLLLDKYFNFVSYFIVL